MSKRLNWLCCNYISHTFCRQSQNAATRIDITNVNAGASARAALFTTNNVGGQLFFEMTGGNYNAGAGQEMLAADAGAFGSSGTNGMRLITSAAPVVFAVGYATANEVARITGTGLIGIGTTSPTKILHIVYGAQDPIYLSNTAPSITMGNNAVYASKTAATTVGLVTSTGNFLTSSVVGDAIFAGTNNLVFGTGLNSGVASGTIKMTLTTAGLLGIGVTGASVTSTLHVSGSISAPIVAKTANYTLTSSDHTVTFDGTNLTATLPAASGCSGRMYVICNYNITNLTVSTFKNQSNVDATTVQIALVAE